jgi:ABC-type sugar transport system ATPase subunit
LRPSALRLDGAGVPARVYLTEQLGDSVIVDLHLGDTLVRARLPEKTRLAEGAEVRLGFDAADVHLFDRDSGARL